MESHQLLELHFQKTEVHNFIRNETSPNNESHHNRLYWAYCLFIVNELHTTESIFSMLWIHMISAYKLKF